MQELRFQTAETMQSDDVAIHAQGAVSSVKFQCDKSQFNH